MLQTQIKIQKKVNDPKKYSGFFNVDKVEGNFEELELALEYLNKNKAISYDAKQNILYLVFYYGFTSDQVKDIPKDNLNNFDIFVLFEDILAGKFTFDQVKNTKIDSDRRESLLSLEAEMHHPLKEREFREYQLKNQDLRYVISNIEHEKEQTLKATQDSTKTVTKETRKP